MGRSGLLGILDERYACTSPRKHGLLGHVFRLKGDYTHRILWLRHLQLCYYSDSQDGCSVQYLFPSPR